MTSNTLTPIPWFGGRLYGALRRRAASRGGISGFSRWFKLACFAIMFVSSDTTGG